MKISSAAFTMLIIFLCSYTQAQNVGISISSPQARLHVNDGSLLVTGTGSLYNAGQRMVWLSSSSAFRSGRVSGLQWNADSVGLYSFATGENVVASGIRSASTGYNNRSVGPHSFTTGEGNTVTGLNSMAAGMNNRVTSDYSFALGSASTVSDHASGSLGFANKVSGFSSFAIGYNNNVVSDYSVCIGRDSYVNSPYGLAIGLADTVGNFSSAVAIGAHNKATGISSVALNGYNRSSGDYSVSINRDNRSVGSSSFAGGEQSMASGNMSLAFGYQSYTGGIHSFALGYRDSTFAPYSYSFGSDNKTRASYALALCWNNIASNHAEVVIGRFADTLSTSYPLYNLNGRLFAVGNGINSSNRTNALSVFMNGRVGIGGVQGMPAATLEVNGTAKVEALQVANGTVMKNVQASTYTVGASTGQSKVVTVTFATEFSSTPKIVCTPRTQTGQSYTDVFCVTTKNISTTQFTVTIFRVDATTPWSQSLLLDWYAWEQ